jgi:hypothetical protein
MNFGSLQALRALIASVFSNLRTAYWDNCLALAASRQYFETIIIPRDFGLICSCIVAGRRVPDFSKCTNVNSADYKIGEFVFSDKNTPGAQRKRLKVRNFQFP